MWQALRKTGAQCSEGTSRGGGVVSECCSAVRVGAAACLVLSTEGLGTSEKAT